VVQEGGKCCVLGLLCCQLLSPSPVERFNWQRRTLQHDKPSCRTKVASEIWEYLAIHGITLLRPLTYSTKVRGMQPAADVIS